MMNSRLLLPLLLGVMIVVMCTLSGCGAKPEAKPAETAVGEISSQLVRDTPTSTNQVDHITFVGLQESCVCTRNRIDESWRVLQNVLVAIPSITVQRIQRDVNKEEALALHEVKAMMVTPGIYFLDSEQNIIELLQGEVTEEQILELLVRPES